MSKQENPKKALRWFLDFLNADIPALANDQLFNLWDELRRRAYGPLGVFVVQDRDLIDWPKQRQRALGLQGFLRGLLQKILQTAQRKKKRLIRPLFEITEAMQEYLEWDEEEGPKPSTSVPDYPGALEAIILTEVQRKPLPEWVQNWIADSRTIRLHILADRDRVFSFFTRPEDRLILDFISHLSQFPLSSIRTCQRPDCGKYFLKATKKEKRYCSNKCVWIMASRERRAAQPEVEKAKKRASYERRIKRKLGPGVKVQRRV